MLGEAGGLGLAPGVLLFSLDSQSFSGSRGPLTAHLHPEEKPRGQSRGSRRPRETEGLSSYKALVWVLSSEARIRVCWQGAGAAAQDTAGGWFSSSQGSQQRRLSLRSKAKVF